MKPSVSIRRSDTLPFVASRIRPRNRAVRAGYGAAVTATAVSQKATPPPQSVAASLVSELATGASAPPWCGAHQPHGTATTPGRTREACGFRDASDRFADLGAVVLGVSRDSAAAHEKFRAKHRLPFALLVDADHAVAEKYGAWREKTLYGKKSMGIVRSTFVIDAGGRVAKVFRSVKPDGHAEQVLAALAELA